MPKTNGGIGEGAENYLSNAEIFWEDEEYFIPLLHTSLASVNHTVSELEEALKFFRI